MRLLWGKQISRQRSGTTRTWRQSSKDGPVDDPVQSLQHLPDGPTFHLDTYRFEDRARRWVTIGSDADRDVHLDDDTVSALHCVLCRDRDTGRVYVADADSKNGTRINGMEIDEGTELGAGCLLSIGRVILLARGQAGDNQRPIIAASDLDEFLRQAIPVYGSQRKAGDALRIKPATFSRWLARRKFDTQQ